MSWSLYERYLLVPAFAAHNTGENKWQEVLGEEDRGDGGYATSEIGSIMMVINLR